MSAGDVAWLAALLIADVAELHRKAAWHLAWPSPGKTVEPEAPVPVGSRIDTRREMPGTPRAALDKGWTVAWYTRRSDGRWSGYVLLRKTTMGGPVESTTMSRCEAFDLVERYEVGADVT